MAPVFESDPKRERVVDAAEEDPKRFDLPEPTAEVLRASKSLPANRASEPVA